MTDHNTILLLVPELVLALMAVLLLLGSSLVQGRGSWLPFAVGSFLVAAYAAYRQDLALVGDGWLTAQMVGATSGPLLVDTLGHAVRWAALLFGFLLVISAAGQDRRKLSGEYFGLLLLVTVGLMLVGVAGDLVLLFLGLELISIPTYVLLFIGSRNSASSEATLKYFFLSILSSALLLYGLSFLYGLAGSTSLVDIHGALAAAVETRGTGGLWPLGGFAVALVFAGIGFKLAVVPFHFYAPDVYQGTTNANAGLLAVVPKIAGVVTITRLLVYAMPGYEQLGWKIALVIALLTMTLGNVTALWQDHLRRLLAYSSIAHAGYMFVGLTVGLAAVGSGFTGADYTGADGVAAMFFYLLVYSIATVGTFACLICLEGGSSETARVRDLSGLAQSRPWVAGCLAVFMFSLAGIPPLAGFWGKFSLFSGTILLAGGGDRVSPWLVILAVVGMLNAAISAAYYLRIVGVMFFTSGAKTWSDRGSAGASVAMIASAVLVIALGLLPGPAMQSARIAADAVQAGGLKSRAEAHRAKGEASPQISSKRLPVTTGPGF